MNLPKNWYKRLDNNPGTIRWWTEYATWKTTGYCNHRFLRSKNRGWKKANKNCDLAWQCEYDWLKMERPLTALKETENR